MATEARINYDRALLQGDMDKAQTYVEQLAAVDKSEADYRFVISPFEEKNMAILFEIKLVAKCC